MRDKFKKRGTILNHIIKALRLSAETLFMRSSLTLSPYRIKIYSATKTSWKDINKCICIPSATFLHVLSAFLYTTYNSWTVPGVLAPVRYKLNFQTLWQLVCVVSHSSSVHECKKRQKNKPLCDASRIFQYTSTSEVMLLKPNLCTLSHATQFLMLYQVHWGYQSTTSSPVFWQHLTSTHGFFIPDQSLKKKKKNLTRRE